MTTHQTFQIGEAQPVLGDICSYQIIASAAFTSGDVILKLDDMQSTSADFEGAVYVYDIDKDEYTLAGQIGSTGLSLEVTFNPDDGEILLLVVEALTGGVDFVINVEHLGEDNTFPWWGWLAIFGGGVPTGCCGCGGIGYLIYRF